ncbi:hypothetical protein J4464_04390 [Candidatus Woesearchaeota archaeon]|nr:hypothetical protein [Candidatus Woesearchaeota archaeon]
MPKKKKVSCRHCPNCGVPMVDLDYMCKKCGATCEPKNKGRFDEYGTSE